ncbi:fluoride efflux transporter FluC [Fructobacillus durionis]|uniref:Fluoride-specific ion channel FluC n=1 Tax=Fructobacillus durionis TaxID=283737 RepID=A0A1I1HHK3_9LACO|nr:CrcB family protein [Fructobacillus durionis]SFC21448.1 CrcB protein [Fructobacillus durionis]
MVNKLLLVILGTGVGAVLRYWLMTMWTNRGSFLTGVWLVNLIGSFTLGALFELKLNQPLVLLVETGILGGLTTFSSMMTEGAAATSNKREAAYLTVQMLTGFIAFIIGYSLFSMS